MSDVALGQVYRDPRGGLMLFVREETRKDVEGYLCVGTLNRVIHTTWIPVNTVEIGELVNDTAGRVEAQLAQFEIERLQQEREAFQAAMRQAVNWLSQSQADDLRALYLKRLKAAA